MKRKIIEINEGLCNGCGSCVTGCSEGALQIINGKAKVVNETFCDGFGDCIGHCPTGALKIIERDAAEFNIKAVETHLRDNYGETAVDKMRQAQQIHGNKENEHKSCPGGPEHGHHGGCPSAKFKQFIKNENTVSATSQNMNSNSKDSSHEIKSELTQWPIQLHLVPPRGAMFDDRDLLIAASCTAFSFGDFHRKILSEKSLVIACPKLDNTDGYIEKLTAIFEMNKIKSITCAIMEVPCCGGLLRMVKTALAASGKNIPLKIVTLGIEGNIKDIQL